MNLKALQEELDKLTREAIIKFFWHFPDMTHVESMKLHQQIVNAFHLTKNEFIFGNGGPYIGPKATKAVVVEAGTKGLKEHKQLRAAVKRLAERRAEVLPPARKKKSKTHAWSRLEYKVKSQHFAEYTQVDACYEVILNKPGSIVRDIALEVAEGGYQFTTKNVLGVVHQSMIHLKEQNRAYFKKVKYGNMTVNSWYAIIPKLKVEKE